MARTQPTELSEEEKRDRTYKVLKRGSEDGQELLTWLKDRNADSASATTALAWALGWIVANAPSEQIGHNIMETHMRSLCLYTKFFEDMSEEDRQAGGLRH